MKEGIKAILDKGLQAHAEHPSREPPRPARRHARDQQSGLGDAIASVFSSKDSEEPKFPPYGAGTELANGIGNSDAPRIVPDNKNTPAYGKQCKGVTVPSSDGEAIITEKVGDFQFLKAEAALESSCTACLRSLDLEMMIDKGSFGVVWLPSS